MKQRGYIFLKVVLPLIYILIFLPQLNNQIAPNNHNLIITLTTIENWMDEGALHHNFNLVHSWGNEGDKNVCYYKRVMNEEGRNYFVSYPPFATILIYPFLQMFPKEYLPLGFKLFGMIFHVLTYLALLVLFRERSEFQRLFGANDSSLRRFCIENPVEIELNSAGARVELGSSSAGTRSLYTEGC